MAEQQKTEEQTTEDIQESPEAEDADVQEASEAEDAEVKSEPADEATPEPENAEELPDTEEPVPAEPEAGADEVIDPEGAEEPEERPPARTPEGVQTSGTLPEDQAPSKTTAEFVSESKRTPSGGDGSVAISRAEDEEGPVPRMLEQKVEDLVGEVEEDMEMDIQKREEPESEEDEGGVPLTAIDDEEDLEHTGGSLGFTGEVQGRTITMEDLEEEENRIASDPDYEELMALYEGTMTEVEENTIVQGRVVSVTDREVVVDIGFKSDGVIPRGEFEGHEITPGDAVEVYVEHVEDRRGQLVLSKERADEVRLWQRFEEAYENEEVVEGEILRRIKGGMIVDLHGVEAFLPGSQIDVRPVRDYEEYVGKRMEFKIVKLNPANTNIVISHKALIQEELEEQRREILENIEVGQVLEGTVKNIVDFGAFIDLGGVDGLLHITDLSWGRVSHPSEVVSLGEDINVVVLDYDEERQRISLGLKQLQEHPWDNIGDKYSEGDTVEGKVVSITDYGAFVELEKGIEGLVHISEMSWTEHIKHPSQKCSLGQLLEVKILNINQEEKKISLGLKQLEPNPWEGLADRYPPGTILEGTVRNITNFGVFVEIEPGIDGLVHISDLSWTKKIRHPSEVVDEGEEMEVVILDVDEERQRVSLGHKQVQTNPWEQFEKAYSEGSDTTGEVLRFVDNGIIVELPLEVEAFIPASQLDREFGGDHAKAYEGGEELDLRVIDFDKENRKIVLSEKAKKHAEKRAKQQAEKMERRKEQRQKRKQVKKQKKEQSTRGATTLGELSGLEDLREALERKEALEEEEVEELEAAVEEADEDVTAEELVEEVTESEAEEESGETEAAEAEADVATEEVEPAEAEETEADAEEDEAGEEDEEAEGDAEAADAEDAEEDEEDEEESEDEAKAEGDADAEEAEEDEEADEEEKNAS